MVYLDWAATSPPDPACIAEGAAAAIRHFGNPSSAHAEGRSAREALESWRGRLLAAIDGHPDDADRPRTDTDKAAFPRLVLTASGTEADGIPLLSLLARHNWGAEKPHVVMSAIEHAAVHEQARLLERLGIPLSPVRPGADGCIDPGALAEAIRPETALVAVMAVNNETGAIQPLRSIVEAVRDAASAGGGRSPRIHVDAVQALGKIPFDPSALGLSSAAFSAHKLGGPRGVGSLWLGSAFESLAVGGGQEGGYRPGTENLPGLVSFTLAAESAVAGREAEHARSRLLEARLLEGLTAMGALPLPLCRLPGDARYLPSILSVAFPGLSGEVFVRALSDAGYALSTGSACSTNVRKKSERRVLEAMGVPTELAQTAIRISTGPATSLADIDGFLESASGLYRRLKV